MERLIEFLRKPRFTTKNEKKAIDSTFQWGWGWEWDPDAVEDEDMYWTLSILGIINGLPRISKRYRLFVMGAKLLDIGGYDYSNATLRIKNWPKMQEEMHYLAIKRLLANKNGGLDRLMKDLDLDNDHEV